MTGGFVELCVSSTLCSSIFACEHQRVSGAFACQWGCVECSDRSWEYVRSCAGSKQPSLSLCQGRQNADCHIWLAGCCCCKSSNLLRHLCYLCHHITSFMCFSAALPAPLCLFSFFYRQLQGEPWICDQRTLVPVSPRGREKVSRKQDVSASCLWVFTYSGMWIYTQIAFALPNIIRPEVAWDGKELLWTE